MSEQKARRRVGDVVPPQGGLGDTQYHVRDLVGQEFEIVGIAEWDGDDGPYMAVKIEIDGRAGFFFSSHVAIFRKLQQCAGQLPLLATVLKKEGKATGREYFDIE